ncbi:hypothetical protein [Spiroplasma poulsonii]|uniref:Uncharacterized protein n=1 Tax=Spiroplasma poulsonii TaxID=2138 RepID=A0A2P6F9V2_9MOLU|nr:hypothetical protein [Spiroplasma poulsonii]PQM30232.1 hypothetical protein SMSRO_SF025110 [Spiroplasma poulsonii]
MRLVNGKDILFKSHRKDILQKLNWWYETYKIKEKLDKNELTASLMGKTIFGLLETKMAILIYELTLLTLHHE